MPSGWFPQPRRAPRSPWKRHAGVSPPAEEHVGGAVIVQVVDGTFRARHATRRERLLSRVLVDRLDRALAAGVSPEASVVLSLRAERLIRPTSRSALARSIYLLLGSAAESSTFLPSAHRTFVNSRRVLVAAAELRTLAVRLLAPAPVAARGVATTRLLLTDGAGPLYWADATTDLRATICQAISALDPTGDWPDLRSG